MDDLDKLIKRMEKLTSHVEVGAMNPEAARKLAYAEFGTETSPARPVLSATFDKNQAAIDRAIKGKVQAMMDGKEITGSSILKGVGTDLMELVVEEMGGPPTSKKKALAPSTLKGRRSRGNFDATPLVDRSMLTAGQRALIDSLEVKGGAGPGSASE